MQYATGASTDPGNELSDPFLMTVPPVQQYANNFTITSSDSVGAGFTETYMNILASAQFFDDTRVSQQYLTTVLTLQSLAPHCCSQQIH